MKKIKNLIRLLLRRDSDLSQFAYLINHGMKVGKDFVCYSMSGIDPSNPQLIEIGDNVLISSGVTLLTHDASTLFVNCGTKLGKIKIGNHVFIGAKTIILCNVEIGDNVIVGAGSVVSKNLEAGGVYVGSPARRICSIEEYEDKYKKLRQERPDMSTVMPWSEWKNANAEQRKIMVEATKDGPVFY